MPLNPDFYGRAVFNRPQKNEFTSSTKLVKISPYGLFMAIIDKKIKYSTVYQWCALKCAAGQLNCWYRFFPWGLDSPFACNAVGESPQLHSMLLVNPTMRGLFTGVLCVPWIQNLIIKLAVSVNISFSLLAVQFIFQKNRYLSRSPISLLVNF